MSSGWSQNQKTMTYPGLMTSITALTYSWLSPIVFIAMKVEGKQTYKDNWKQVNQKDIKAYMPLFILSSVYLSRNESTSSVQYGMQSHFRNFINTTNSDKIFIVIISLKKKKNKTGHLPKKIIKEGKHNGFQNFHANLTVDFRTDPVFKSMHIYLFYLCCPL